MERQGYFRRLWKSGEEFIRELAKTRALLFPHVSQFLVFIKSKREGGGKTGSCAFLDEK